jgi:uncharacterized heparinase superfamily protein
VTLDEYIPDLDCLRRRGLDALGGLVFRIPAYRYSLLGRAPREIRAAPDPWPGQPAAGDAIVAGRFTMGGETVAGDLAAFETRGGEAWQEAFHGFEWLRDLRALGGETAHQRARKLIKDWIARNERWSRTAWRGDVAGRRLASWIAHYDFFAAGADPGFREQVLARVALDAKHLARTVPGGLEGAALLAAAKGMAVAGLALPGGQKLMERGLSILSAELPHQILADGGHVERSPSLQVTVLRDMIDVRAALVAAQQPVPDAVQIAIDRMAPMLRFFRLSDGGLAVFNGGGEEEPWLVDLVLSRAEARGKPLAAAPHSGFQKLSAGRSVLVMDAGAPAKPRCGRGGGYAGTLSFELGMGKDRVVVNCGASVKRSPAWAKAARATAAHSTLVVADTNSSEVTEKGLGRGPKSVTARRIESLEGDGIEAQHDGYVVPFGLVHRRRLQLSANGEELRGEDTLIAAPLRRRKAMARSFAVRFHLHPDAKASLLPEGRGVLIKLGSGAGMRFAATGGEVALEDSVYLGSGELRRTQQIVIAGTSEAISEGEAAVAAWSFTRV